MLNVNAVSPYVRAALTSTLRPGLVFKERALFDYELIWFISSGFSLLMNDKSYETKQGDIILIPPGVNHTIVVPPDSSPLHAHIHFDVTYTPSSEFSYVSYKNLADFTEEERRCIQPDFFGGELEYPFLNVSNRKVFLSLVEDVIRTYHNKPVLYQLICKEQMTALLRMIIRDNISELRSFAHEEPDFISSVKSFIDANFLNSRFNLDDLSEQFHYNKFYLVKKFRSTYGVSLIKYCNSLRSEYAKKKLEEGLSPSRVGDLLGFPDIYSFSRFFKMQCGQSPSAYLRELRGKQTL